MIIGLLFSVSSSSLAQKEKTIEISGLVVDAGDSANEPIYYGRDKDQNLRFRVMADGTGGSDDTWAEFSPVIAVENPAADDYLDWALEDAEKPHKPYKGLWDVFAENTVAKSHGVTSSQDELDKYGKSAAKISIGTSMWAKIAREKIVELEDRIALLEAA